MDVIRAYIRLILEKKKDLILEPDLSQEGQKSREDEASVVGSIAGVTTPLGTDSTHPKKPKKKKNRKSVVLKSFANSSLAFNKDS